MSTIIINQIVKAIREAINTASLKENVMPKEVQFRVCLKVNEDDGNLYPHYYLLNNYKLVSEITVNEVFKIGVDLMGVKAQTPMFIANTIIKLSEKQGCDPMDVHIYILTLDEEVKDIKLIGYYLDKEENKYQKIEINGSNEITFDYIIGLQLESV